MHVALWRMMPHETHLDRYACAAAAAAAGLFGEIHPGVSNVGVYLSGLIRLRILLNYS